MSSDGCELKRSRIPIALVALPLMAPERLGLNVRNVIVHVRFQISSLQMFVWIGLRICVWQDGVSRIASSWK